MLDSLKFAFNSVSPIILTVAVGYILKKVGLMNADFSKTANKLVFRVFLPTMLFMNVYGIGNIADIDFGYVLYAAVFVLAVFFIAMPAVRLITPRNECRGVLAQSFFRSNYALIGIPLASALFGSEGAIIATLLSAVLIPLFNILAVIALCVFRKGGDMKGIKNVLLGILKNPLIIGIAAGLLTLAIRALFVRYGVSVRLSGIPAVYDTLKYISSLATPMALLTLGAQFEFSAIAELKREIIAGTLVRSLIVPSLALGIAYFAFGDKFNGAHFAAFVAAFCTPVAVSSVPMAQEMDADASLAGQLVVFTTLGSAFSVFIASFILSAVGVF